MLLMAGIGVSNAKIKVVTSLSDLADLTRQIGGDKVDVDNIVRGTQNPHFIEVKPSYMLKLRSADLFIIAGMQLEMWAPQIIDGSGNSHLRMLDCSEHIAKLDVPSGKVDASQGDVHPFGNPHYWLDPENVKIITQDIVDALSKLSPPDEAYFRAKRAKYVAELDQKSREWTGILAPFAGRPMVTYHTSFNYFAHFFKLNVAGYVEPKPGIPPSPSHTAELIRMIRAEGIRVIGVEQFYEQKSPQEIANATGAKMVLLSTSVGGMNGTDSYIALMDYNVRAIANAMK